MSSREPKVDLQGDHAGQQNRKLQAVTGKSASGMIRDPFVAVSRKSEPNENVEDQPEGE